jgi:hypothetical protein
MHFTICCAICRGAIGPEHYQIFDHVTCTPPAPAPQAEQDAEQAFQVMQEEFLAVQRTLQQAPPRPGR